MTVIISIQTKTQNQNLFPKLKTKKNFWNLSSNEFEFQRQNWKKRKPV